MLVVFSIDSYFLVQSSQLLTKNLEVDCIRIKKDNSRLKDGFTSVCSINEKLKKQV